MLAFVLCLGLFVMLMALRSRLEAAESRARALDLALAVLRSDLASHAKRLQALQARLDLAQPRAVGSEGQVAAPVLAPAAPSDAPQASAGIEPPPAAAADPEPIVPAPASVSEPSPRVPAPWAPQPSVAQQPAAYSASQASVAHQATGPDPFDVAFEFLRELLFGGNTVVRAGILVFLVGVVLLLGWAAEHDMFPIELRLSAVALGAMALTVVGFRQRESKPGFSRALQGGGIAALYLVTFFAFRSYGLLPASLAFAVLLGIAVSSGVLAVVQDSLSLILIGQLFGFMAPLLASTGKGSHVALFSYYLLLNLLTFGVAWFKAWRALNLLGFLFTFGVATAWGALRYDPALFASTEPFLIAFFLLYLAIPVLYALRHPGARRGWVDGSLVFGTPLAALGLQWALVHDKPFGMAYSVLALGAVYLGSATFLRRRGRVELVAMTEAFLPIGVGFATLAIPYGFDNHNLTGAAWGLEGAGLYWVGVRQKRWLSRAAGIALQLLAGGAIAFNPERGAQALPVLNTWCLAGVLLGVSSLFVARYSHARRSELPTTEWRGAQLLIVWGLGFVLRAGFGEIESVVPLDQQPGCYLALLGALGLSLETVGRRLAWRPGRLPALLLWPVMALFLAHYGSSLDAQPFSHGGFLGWPLVAIAMTLSLRDCVDTGPAWLRYAHPLALWLWSAFAVLLAEQLTEDAAHLDRNFVFAAGSMAGVAALLLVLALSKGAAWPIGVHRALYLREGVVVLAGYLLLRCFGGNFSLPGSAHPLPYLPVLNPVDIAELLVFAAVLSWRHRASGTPALLSPHQRQLVLAVVAGLSFLWWNGLLARSVHHYVGVPFEQRALFRSTHMQVACSLSWTLIALTMMLVAHRQAARTPWIVGATLLAIVVAKLFLIDLERLSTPAKIISFLGVGALLLLIGYIAPVPPRAAVDAPEDRGREP